MNVPALLCSQNNKPFPAQCSLLKVQNLVFNGGQRVDMFIDGHILTIQVKQLLGTA